MEIDNNNNNNNNDADFGLDEMLINFYFEEDRHDNIHNTYRKLLEEYTRCMREDSEKGCAAWIVKVEKQIYENPDPIIPFITGVRNVYKKYNRNQIAGHLARVTFENMINNIPTLKYYVKNILDFDDLLSNNTDSKNLFIFYDGGRGATLGTVQYMSGKTRKNEREVIVIDALPRARYCGLANHLQQVKAHLNGVQDIKDRIECVANYVCNAMGGPRVNLNTVKRHIESLRSSNKFDTLVGEVLLGTIQLGVCRHRSILFKWLCDHREINIPTRLVQGNLSGGGHAWNVCLVNEIYYLVDVMNFSYATKNQYSSALLDLETDVANAYKRTGGTLGGESVQAVEGQITNKNDLEGWSDRKNFLGRGAFGEVLKVTINKRGLTKIFALKEMAENNNTTINGHMKEVRILKSVYHRNIIKYKAHFEGETVGRNPKPALYIVLEYADGGSLQDLINDNANGLIDTMKLCFLLHHVTLGMSYLHQLGMKQGGRERRIIHRDLKPANILICNGVAKIADFGISKILEGSAIAAGITNTCGTTSYMAPEQRKRGWNDIMSHKVDLWSFGVIVGYCLSGKSPFNPHDRYIRNVEIYSEDELNGGALKSKITNNKLHQDLKEIYHTFCIGTTQVPKRNGKSACIQNISQRGEFSEIEEKLRDVLLESCEQPKSAVYVKWEKEIGTKAEVYLHGSGITDEDITAK